MLLQKRVNYVSEKLIYNEIRNNLLILSCLLHSNICLPALLTFLRVKRGAGDFELRRVKRVQFSLNLARIAKRDGVLATFV